MEALGLTRDRWILYREKLRGLNLYGVLKGDAAIEFRVDPGSISNGDSYKGYWYTTIRPAHVRPNLDTYLIADEDKDQNGNYIVFKELDGNWYLYLFVNR